MVKNALATESRPRFQALDGLRGVAALFVVLLHVDWTNHLTDNRLIQHSYVAVDLFFILSGFVISSNYLRRINTPREARTFLGLRFFRLYPLHFAMLAAFMCLECAKLFAHQVLGVSLGAQPPFTGGNSLGSAIANLFLINGLHVIHRPGWNDPSWSISCEFTAYILFAIATLTGLVRNRLFFAGGTLLAVAGYACLAIVRGTLNVTLDWGIVRCVAGFFLGMLIFRLKGKISIYQSTMAVGVGSIAVVVVILGTMAFASGPWIALVIPLFVVAIALLQADKGLVAGVLISPVVQLLGRISYSIYMIHSILIVGILIILKRAFVLPTVAYPMRENPIVMINPWVGDLLVVGIVVCVVATASATYAFIEEPGRLFGRRLFARRRERPYSIVSL